MQKKLTKIGSSLGIIIDKPVLDLLRITTDTPLEVTTDGDRLILQPLRHADDATARPACERIATRHRKSLNKLAE
ncbi:MAG TPA: AbrB/MazE/SpoVT family DNA-binding domain-containing protein [Phycisphaerae bacterium]|nr:AbrB/MazE/SpoVT family DNA-binding domain-containing protein [Phycisphaerae bacterium]